MAVAYESEWPLLVICPSSARFHWEAELIKWLDKDLIPTGSILVVTSGSQVRGPGVGDRGWG